MKLFGLSARHLAATLILAGAALSARPGDGQAPAAAAPAPSLKITLTGTQGQQSVVDASQFAALEQKTITVHNGHSGVDETYEGVPLSALLKKVGAPDQPMGKAASVYLVAEGADHYRVVLSLTEAMPAFHSGDVLVADRVDGQPISKDGPLKLVVSEDKHPARWVRNLVAVTLVQAP